MRYKPPYQIATIGPQETRQHACPCKCVRSKAPTGSGIPVVLAMADGTRYPQGVYHQICADCQQEKRRRKVRPPDPTVRDIERNKRVIHRLHT
jgi:hypothetical protein